MKSKEIWSKRSKKHVILISQTAHTNPWIYRDPKLIMILTAWLAGGLMQRRATHSSHAGNNQTTNKFTSKPNSLYFTLSLTSCSDLFLLSRDCFLYKTHPHDVFTLRRLYFIQQGLFLHKCSLKKKNLAHQICLNIWLMMFISPKGHRGLISSLATWWPISSYSRWEEGDGWGYNHPLLRHIFVKLFRGAGEKTFKPIRRLPDLSIC